MEKLRLLLCTCLEPFLFTALFLLVCSSSNSSYRSSATLESVLSSLRYTSGLCYAEAEQDSRVRTLAELFCSPHVLLCSPPSCFCYVLYLKTEISQILSNFEVFILTLGGSTVTNPVCKLNSTLCVCFYD